MFKEISPGTGAVTIIREASGNIKVQIKMDKESFSFIEDMASQRGLSIVSTIGEAIRLERLFAEVTSQKDKGLYLRKGDSLREILKP